MGDANSTLHYIDQLIDYNQMRIGHLEEENIQLRKMRKTVKSSV